MYYGDSLPKKTRFEHMRDQTIKKIIKTPFLQEFITGEYNSLSCWSAVCWNFLRAKWDTSRMDCFFFMLLLLINSVIISFVTLPTYCAMKIGWVTVNTFDRAYTWASDRMVDLVVKHSNLTMLRQATIKKMKKCMKVTLYTTSIISFAYMLNKAYKFYKNYQSQALSEGGPLPVDENHKVDHWAPVVITKVPPSLKSSTTTPEQLMSLIHKKMASASLECVETGRKSQICLFPLCGNVWLINSHVITGYEQKISVIIREPGTVGPNFTDIISSNSCYDIPDNDLTMIILNRGGSQFDFVDYFPIEKELNRCMGALLYKDNLAVCSEQRVVAEPRRFIHYEGPKGKIKVQGYHYRTNTPTFEGMCMAPLVTFESKPQIKGFHCCGKTGQNEGGATMVSQADLRTGLENLSKRRGVMIAHSLCTDGLNLRNIGPYKNVELTGVIHKNSPFRFIEEGSFDLYGQTNGPRQKQTSAVVRTKISEAVEDEFGIPCIWGKPEGLNTYVPIRNEVLRMNKIHAMNPDIMAIACYDFNTSVIDSLPAEAIRGIQPLNREIVLSGQDGISQLRCVAMSKSAGSPYNVPKDRILERSGLGNEFINDIVTAPQYVWDRVEQCEKLLLNKKRCNFIFKASLKDEAKKIGSGKVRVFAGVSLEGLIIVRKYFLPLAVVIMRNPFPFESAVGINAHGLDWDRFVKHVTKRGRDRMIAGDYAGFDSSMSPTVSFAAFTCLLHLAVRCGYSVEDIEVMRGIATEICYPTYDFFGEIITVAGSEPSGHPMTVFINNIVNSLYIRYAYYSIYEFDRNRLFNSYVTQMNYGDDNVMSVSLERPDFNHTAIQRALARYGVVYTMADKEGVSIPFINMEDCSFLKRAFRHDSVRDVYLGPLEVMSLYKTLHTCVKSNTVSFDEQNMEMIKSLMFEVFLHGETFYNDFHAKLSRVLQKCGLVWWFPLGLPTFASQQEVWDERYLEHDNKVSKNPHGSGVVGESFLFD